MGYDATQLLINAAQETSGCDDAQTCREAIKQALVKNGLDTGATGRIRFADTGNRIVESSDRVSVLVSINVAERTFECIAGEPCAQ